MARPTTWIAVVICGTNEKGHQSRPIIVIRCCMSHMLSEVWRYIQIKQEFAREAMSELRRSVGKLELSPDCWLLKIYLLFCMYVIVGLTTIDKL